MSAASELRKLREMLERGFTIERPLPTGEGKVTVSHEQLRFWCAEIVTTALARGQAPVSVQRIIDDTDALFNYILRGRQQGFIGGSGGGGSSGNPGAAGVTVVTGGGGGNFGGGAAATPPTTSTSVSPHHPPGP